MRPDEGKRVAIVGAGMAGLCAATSLTSSGYTTRLFDKSRGTGGRLSTRRDGDLAFDLGAQYFTARDGEFVAQVERWQAAGVVAPWEGTIATLGPSDREPSGQSPPARWVGTPRMSALGRHLAELSKQLLQSLVS